MAQDQTTVEDKPALNVVVDDSGPARKILTIEIPEARIKGKVEETYDQLQDDAQLPGFRRGRAPRRLLEKRFGSSVQDDVKGQLLSECFDEAVKEQELAVIGEPDIKEMDEIELPESGTLTFKVEVEVTPKVELPDFSKLKVKRTKVQVTDDDVDEQIEQYRQRFGRSAQIPDAKIDAGDIVQADVRILAGSDASTDDEIDHLPGTYIYVTGKDRDYKGQIAGILVDDLGKQFKGKQIGDALVLSMTGPETHENEKIRSQPITVEAKISRVERTELASVQQVVEHLGAESLEQLRGRLREFLDEQNLREQQADMHRQISDQLVEQVNLELPEGLTGRQVERVIQRQRLELLYRGVAESEIDQQLAEMRSQSEDTARNQLQQFFVLDQAAKDLAVEVSSNEVNGRVSMMAVQQGRRPEKLRQQLQQRGELEQLYLQIREQKTLDRILDSASITEVEAEPASATKKKSTTKAAQEKPAKKTSKKKTASSKKGES